MLTEIMNGHDVRMVERCDGSRLLLEPAQTVRVARKRGGQDFYSNITVQPCVPRAIDFAHPARAGRRDNLVGSEFGTGAKSHSLVIIV